MGFGHYIICGKTAALFQAEKRPDTCTDGVGTCSPATWFGYMPAFIKLKISIVGIAINPTKKANQLYVEIINKNVIVTKINVLSDSICTGIYFHIIIVNTYSLFSPELPRRD